jgi:AraC-like DNA-binding protein
MVSTCVPVILAGTVYYYISVNNVYQKNQEDSLVALSLIMDRVERVLSEIETKSLEMSVDPLMVDALSTKAFNEKEITRLRLLNTLSRVQVANEFIAEILYYDIRGQSLLDSNYGHIRADQYVHRNELDAAMQSPFSAQWTRFFDGKQTEYLSFIHKLPHMKQTGFDGLLVFNVNIGIFKTYLQDNSFHVPDKTMLVLDSDGNWLLSSHEGLSVSSRADRMNDTVRGIVHSEHKSGVFFAKDSYGKNELYSFRKTLSGRTYISFIPETNISSQLQWIRWVTAGAVILLLFLGIVLSVITSMRAYKLIQQLFTHGRSFGFNPNGSRNEFGYIRECLNYLHQERRALSLYVSQIQPNLREQFFQKLLQKGYPEITLLQEDCASLQIDVENHYMVLVVVVENIHKEKRFLPEDQAILGFSLTNVMGELLEQNKSLNGYVFTLNDGNGIAVINSSDMSNLVKEPHPYAQSIYEAIRKYLKLQVSVGIGSMYTHIADVAISYQEALTALQNRMYRDSNNPILCIDELEHSHKQTISLYPTKEEGLIIEAISLGDLEKAQQSLSLFAQTVRQAQSYSYVYQTYHLLLSSLIRYIEQRGGNLSQVLEHNLFDQLKSRKTSTEIYDWFTDSCFPLLIDMVQQTDPHHMGEGRAEILRICEFIKENIYSDISLTQCSEMLDMTPSYVSRLFKKVMGFSFVEYVVHCKVEEAKRLLTNKDLSIAEIASKIGYSERNLNRVFHRYTFLSPGQFRTRYR